MIAPRTTFFEHFFPSIPALTPVRTSSKSCFVLLLLLLRPQRNVSNAILLFARVRRLFNSISHRSIFLISRRPLFAITNPKKGNFILRLVGNGFDSRAGTKLFLSIDRSRLNCSSVDIWMCIGDNSRNATMRVSRCNQRLLSRRPPISFDFQFFLSFLSQTLIARSFSPDS